MSASIEPGDETTKRAYMYAATRKDGSMKIRSQRGGASVSGVYAAVGVWEARGVVSAFCMSSRSNSCMYRYIVQSTCRQPCHISQLEVGRSLLVVRCSARS